MQFKTGGFVYNIAYVQPDPKEWFGLGWPNPLIIRTSLCRLFWRFLTRLLLHIPLFTLLWLFVCTITLIALAVATIIGVVVAGYYWNDEQRPDANPMSPIKHWPKFRGHHVWPIWPLLGIAFLWTWYLAFLELPPFVATHANWFSVGLMGFLITIVGWLIIHFGRKTEVWKMTKGFIKAKKDKVCPIVKFVPPDTTQSG